MQTLTNASVEHTAIGRIVVPPNVPDGFRLFYTTIDFDGRIDDRIREFVKPAELFSCHQVHGVNSVRAGFSRPDRLKPVHTQEPECDALWSDRKNSALAIKVSDCLPVSIIDTRGILANIHSGWRGAVQQITAKTLDAAPLDPRSSIAFLGPSIRVCCFEGGEEVAAQFDGRFVDRNRGPKPHVDIAAFTANVLRDRGFERIVDTELCTRCPGSIFHSYRRDKQSGRNL
ncbi:MAG TPA: polyphenol oxidase family protein, partial [Thermoanaerobaculia bacterium]|nr:polyphenol oxidase family protein [Thermoanaerobaculia bacterium]